MSNTDCMFAFIRSLFERTGVDHRDSSPYHPQTNGLDEQMNQTLVHALNKLTTEEGQWDQFIDVALYAYHISIQDSSLFSSFVLLYYLMQKQAKLLSLIILWSSLKLEIIHTRQM